MYTKPNGDKRHPLAYSPFSGGSRVCLGKTFAEITLKFTIPLYYHFFDFELVEEEHKKVRPIITLGSSKAVEIPTKLITRNKVPQPPTDSQTKWRKTYLYDEKIHYFFDQKYYHIIFI